MERKFSFVSNCIEGNSYALVMASWKLDIDGNRIDTVNETKTGLTLQECFDEAVLFVERNKD
jgi:hypothetical protein